MHNMRATATPYIVALLAVAGVSWLSSVWLDVLGLASAALLFLLPVLYAATRGGIGPGLFAALFGAGAFNFFLLPPRFTFRVHGLDNVVSLVVLLAVAIVTSRLATRLMAREAEALERASMGEEAAELSAILGAHPARSALQGGLDLVSGRYGDLVLVSEDALQTIGAAFSSLDLSAAAWAIHNGDVTGHGTQVMGTADWTFFPLVQKNRPASEVAALARPANGSIRRANQLEHLRQLALLLGQCRDRDMLEAERREREMLEQSDYLRRTFMASMAHDFRTPLTVVTVQLALLANTSAGAGEALAAAQRLERMMADLLGAARLESRSLTPSFESLDLVDVIAAACDGTTLPPHLLLTRTLPADLPFVKADPVLLHHVLANLIDNALRHAKSQVALAATQKDGTVCLAISDDGPGVPQAERSRIFDRFIRLEGSDQSSGSGLGLAIAKGFSDAMGMSVSISTAATGGACFTLVFPLAERPCA